jgi:host factor-I protein
MSEPESRRGQSGQQGQSKNQQFVALNRFRREHLRVDVYLVSGIRLTGRIKSFDQYTMLLETGEGDAVVYHHAVSSIGRSMPRPKRAPRDGPREFGARPPMQRGFGRDTHGAYDARGNESSEEPVGDRDDRPAERPRPGAAPDVVVIRRRSRLIPSSGS